MANSLNRTLRVLSVLFAVLVAVGDKADISNLYLATTLTLTFLIVLWNFSDALFDVTVYYGDAAPIVPILRADVLVQDVSGADELEEARGAIEIVDLSFEYPKNSSSVFSHLSLKVAAGEKVGIVGKSGAGKSTLVKLIMRFMDPTEGVILVDGIATKSITQESLRKNISYVSQEPMLFHRSVYQNIMNFLEV